MLKLVIVCVIFFIKNVSTEVCEAENQNEWSYHGSTNGPSKWAELFPDCGKKDESPIEITRGDIINSFLEKLEYNNFDKPITNAMVMNMGWTVMITPEDGIVRSVVWKNQSYNVDNLHFHFGLPGAEHVIDGTRYDMEVHFVTHLSSDPNKTAVLSSIKKGVEEHNLGFDPIAEILRNILYKGSSTGLQSQLNLDGLLPEDTGSYYYYRGSGGFPPCVPGISWLILKEIGNIGFDELNTLMSLYSVGAADASDSCKMSPNYRPLQKLDGRAVIASMDIPINRIE